jgi:hypothetical protein
VPTQIGRSSKPPTRKIIKTHHHTIQFEDKGNEEMVLIVEGKHDHTIALNSQGITISNGKGPQVVLDSSGITVKAEVVKIGSDEASDPLVLGNALQAALTQFLIGLNTHTHLGNLGAPTAPPLPPMQLKMAPALSKKHKVNT